MSGVLYLVATPIGNLEDITYRAVRTLREVDLIACEDTRHTRNLLDRYEIARPLVSYHEHNEATRAEELVAKMLAGTNVALVSDAGMPLVSDPGYRLAAAAISAGISVVPIPGPSAVIVAVILSGLAFLWHWIGAIALVVITRAASGAPQSWQIFPWLPVFFAPTLVLISLSLMARARLSAGAE